MTAPPSFVLVSEALEPGDLQLRRLLGREHVSRPFEIVVEVRPYDRDAFEEKLPEVLRKPVRIGREGEDPLVGGIVRAIETTPSKPAEPPLYRLTIAPRLWYAGETHRTRIFQDLSVPDIVKRVLADLHLVEGDDFELRLQATYGPREYTVQYEESDLDFASRLLEFEGIFYFFEFRNGKDVLVLGDNNEILREVDEHRSIPFGHASAAQGTAVVALGRTMKHVPERVMLVDYNWRTPTLPLVEAATVTAGDGGLQSFGDENFRSPDAGARLARIRAQEIAAQRVLFAGRSDLATLRPGDALTLESSPYPQEEFFVLEVSYEVVQDFRADGGGLENAAFENHFVALDRKTPFRPERRTPRPRIFGSTYATIDGPDLGAAAPIDEIGRYKVVFPFDTSQTGTGKATRWIRMAQPLSGANYGMHFPLRVGAEVVLSYVHGDPDRPVIVGAIPNAVTQSPVAQRNATQSVIQTSSGIRVEFEDEAGRRSS